MDIPFLPASNDQKVYRHSSIGQFKGTLSVLKRGEWLPLVADHIDYIDCDKVVSHKVGITDQDFIGYAYPIHECKYFSDVYLLGHNAIETTEALSTWFGTGYYTKFNNNDVLLNSDVDSLGNSNVYKMRVGLAYCQADETLPPEE